MNNQQHFEQKNSLRQTNQHSSSLKWIFSFLIININYQTCSSWVTTTRQLSSTSLKNRYMKTFQNKIPSKTTTTTTIFSTTVGSKYNVVLEPTIDNPTAFDSFKLGSAKVHRYSSNDRMTTNMATNDDEGTEYVMWYHGRSIELQESDNGQKLPPLSTGRIGRATSRNGIVWKKQTIGSESEDRTDVSLGLNIESWWGFDTKHVGLGTVLLPMSTPAVMTEGGVYLLYYMGGNGEEITLDEYLGTVSSSSSGASTPKIQGMNMKIGVALSQDGISFGRVEGDDPSGAIVVPNNDELYCAWPEVLVRISSTETASSTSQSSSQKNNDSDEIFIMYYSTMLKSTKQKCIAYATSSDGFRWNKHNVCISPSLVADDDDDKNTNDAAGVARCCVTQDAVYNKGTWISIPNAYTMYYEGVSSIDKKHRIMKATSNDCKIWKKVGIALDVGSNENDNTTTTTPWDCNGVGAPNIIRLDDGSSRMYYTGHGQGGSTAIGVAKDIDGTGNWVRELASITFLTV